MSTTAEPGLGERFQELDARIAQDDGAEGGVLRRFAGALLRRAPGGRLDDRPTDMLYEQVASLFAFVDARRDQFAVRVQDSPAGGSELEANLPDAPFLVDTVREAVTSRGYTVRLLLHPVIGVRRSPIGAIEAITDARAAQSRESVIHVELDQRLDAEQAEELRLAVHASLTDLRLAVQDHGAMLDVVSHMIDAANAATSRYSDEEVDETVAFLDWLRDHHFIFLGVREYEIVEADDEQAIEAVPGSGLGILRDEKGSSFSAPVKFSQLPAKLLRRVQSGELLIISKTNRQSTVHRRGGMGDHPRQKD